jgi:hypothetical protein
MSAPRLIANAWLRIFTHINCHALPSATGTLDELSEIGPEAYERMIVEDRRSKRLPDHPEDTADESEASRSVR